MGGARRSAAVWDFGHLMGGVWRRSSNGSRRSGVCKRRAIRLDDLGSRARLLKYFRDGRTQPYAGAGLGLTRIRSAYDYPADCTLTTSNQFQCTSRDVTRRTSTSGTLSGFAGVSIAAGRRLFLRPEFEISRAGEHLRMGGYHCRRRCLVKHEEHDGPTNT